MGMRSEMSGAPSPCSSPPAPGGRLIALLSLAVVLLAGLTGNSFSMHAGMSTKASATSVAQMDHVPGPVAAKTSIGAGTGSLAGAPKPMLPMSSDAQHLMHVLGACLALLAAALLLPLLLVSRLLVRSRAAAVTAPRLVSLATPVRWTPSALDPPTSSPVIRT